MLKQSFLFLAGALIGLGCGDDSTSGGGGAGQGGTASAGGHGGAGGGVETGGGGQGGASSDPCVDDPTAAIPAMQLVPFVEGLERPIHMIPDPTKPGRYFVTERVGKVMIVDDGVVLPEPFLDVSSDVSCCDEDRGFFMIALHPSFADNGLFYVNCSRTGTPASSTTILAEYHRSDADPTKADPEAVRTLIELAQTTVWHYGGTLAFGADGMLYYSRGDGGGEGDPENDAQNPQKEPREDPPHRRRYVPGRPRGTWRARIRSCGRWACATRGA